MNNTDHT